MTFISSKITHKQGNAYEVSGTMPIKDIAKDMNIPFVFHGTAPSSFDKKQIVAGFDTAFSLNRMAFGVGDGKFFNMGVVGDVVNVTISVEALRTP
jgi:polyisoprenoid-binding protein YceI